MGVAELDMAAIYERARQRSLRESIRYAQAEINIAHRDVRYYMCMPRELLVKRGARLMLAFMVCILGCHALLTISVPPMLLILWVKWKNYCSLCAAVNISSSKLNLLLGGWCLFCIPVNMIFWNWITQIYS